MKSLYLLASERSGTNLLRHLLNTHQTYFFGMSPAHLLKHLYFNEPYYGDLSDNVNFKNYIKDAIALCHTHFSPWDVHLDATELVKSYKDRPRSSVYFCDYLMNLYASEKGYESYFCKDNFIHEFATDIKYKLPDSKFIYLYRDPRDFVVSQLKRPNANRSVIHYANVWVYEQTRCIRMALELAQDSRCYSLSYESLIKQPEFHINDICKFLDVPYQQNENDLEKVRDKIVDQVHEWKNLNKAVDASNKEKFKKELSAHSIRIIEAISHKQMLYLGYQPVSQQKLKVTRTDRSYDKIRDILLRLYDKFKTIKSPNPVSVEDRSKLLRKLSINYFNRG